MLLAFNDVKHYLISPPLLTYFSAKLPLVLTCGMSYKALGAYLAHMCDGVARNALSLTEQRYSSTEKEFKLRSDMQYKN